jgi:hypothetical protein
MLDARSTHLFSVPVILPSFWSLFDGWRNEGSFDTHPSICYKDRPCGAVAQLGERLNGIQEVDGSIPFGSTKQNKRLSRSP